MSSREQLREDVRRIVARIAELPVEQVSEEATLASLGIDSLSGLKIVVEVEKRYGIEISEDEITRIRSMPDIFALVDTHSVPK